ncbi:MAG: 1-acyl-sn-glycerol-3-phosphate acyltransferase [Bacteroidaceae bacterium]|nr:1-acyl-sn-glycerol-3-phosphate acyltransferase [Bacteroidaceae bacterium]
MNYDSIRSYNPEELQDVYTRMLAEPMFQQVAGFVLPNVPLQIVEQEMRSCKTNLDFQKKFCYVFLKNLLDKASDGMAIDFNSVDTDKRYTFISNHRDIVLDSAFLSMVLIDAGFSTTCEIAIGDNLLAWPWIEDLVRTIKAFIVRRGLSLREQLMSSKLLASYMHHVITDKNDNLWIAQREGRAKDSDDRTQPAILKMIAMAGEGDAIDRLKEMHISPLCISYEYDPCDILKAQEFQLKRDNPEWKKSKADDVNSMRTGILGYKGHVVYRATKCLDDFLETLREAPKTEIFDLIAAQMDKQIHSAYELFPVNYVALDRLNGTREHFNNGYTAEEEQKVDGYLKMQMQKVAIPNPDNEFLMNCMLTMYANPLKNYLASKK